MLRSAPVGQTAIPAPSQVRAGVCESCLLVEVESLQIIIWVFFPRCQVPIQADRPRQRYAMTSVAATRLHALSKDMFKRPAVGHRKMRVALAFRFGDARISMKSNVPDRHGFLHMKHAWV